MRSVTMGAIVTLVAACRSSPEPPLPAPPVTMGAPAPKPPGSASAAVAGTPVRERPRIEDRRWRAARDEDPLEKARLAVAVGAWALLAGLDEGVETADTALAALPFADEAEIALGRLAEVARGDAARRTRVLAVILAIAGRPPLQREPLDLEGARRCGEALLVIATDGSLPRADRVLAVSAARALAEHGYVDRARIPATLDPR